MINDAHTHQPAAHSLHLYLGWTGVDLEFDGWRHRLLAEAVRCQHLNMVDAVAKAARVETGREPFESPQPELAVDETE